MSVELCVQINKNKNEAIRTICRCPVRDQSENPISCAHENRYPPVDHGKPCCIVKPTGVRTWKTGRRSSADAFARVPVRETPPLSYADEPQKHRGTTRHDRDSRIVLSTCPVGLAGRGGHRRPVSWSGACTRRTLRESGPQPRHVEARVIAARGCVGVNPGTRELRGLVVS